MAEQRYIPAAGWRLLTPLFDPVMAVTTRERRWRSKVVDEALATNPATILDVGCGTGTLAVQLARRAPRRTGDRARRRPRHPGARRRQGAGGRSRRRAAATGWPTRSRSRTRASTARSARSCSTTSRPTPKHERSRKIKRVLRPGGRLVIADYGSPHDPLMRAAFLYVQLLDGFQSTRQHAAGQLPDLIAEAGFNVETIDRLRTISGTLELLAATPSLPPRKDQMSTTSCSGLVMSRGYTATKDQVLGAGFRRRVRRVRRGRGSRACAGCCGRGSWR